MLELLAAALRRDLEERKLWHSLPHRSRSRACDLRKRRACGDGCGRGGVFARPARLARAPGTLVEPCGRIPA